MIKYFVLTEDDQVLGYKSKARARGMKNALDFAYFFDLEDLTRLPEAFILGHYNRLHPEAPLEKFPTRREAMEWMKGVLPSIAKPGEYTPPPQGPGTESPSPGATEMATKVKKAKKKTAAKKAPAERMGRKSQYSGQRLTKLVKDNPRRAGTSGFKSFNLIRSGMSYEDYIKAGGVRRDLEWDVAHNWVKLSKA